MHALINSCSLLSVRTRDLIRSNSISFLKHFPSERDFWFSLILVYRCMITQLPNVLGKLWKSSNFGFKIPILQWVIFFTIFVDELKMDSFKTKTTLCLPNPVFNHSTTHSYTMERNEPLQRLLLECFKSKFDTISFELWKRHYYPNPRDQLIAKVSTSMCD